MTRKEKRLKRRRKAEKKKQRRIWYKGDTCQLKKYMGKNWYFIPHVLEKDIDYLPNPKPKSEEARKYIEKLIEGIISPRTLFGNIEEVTIDEFVEDEELIKK